MIWQAQGDRGQAIIGVIADNAEQARERIAYELSKNPSRLQYKARWEAAGKRVSPELREGDRVIVSGKGRGMTIHQAGTVISCVDYGATKAQRDLYLEVRLDYYGYLYIKEVYDRENGVFDLTGIYAER